MSKYTNVILAYINKKTVRYRFFHDLKNHVRILDLGCGLGHNSIELKLLYPALEIQGIDIIDKTKVPPFIIYKEYDLNNGLLPYPDNYFDAIIFCHVIEHLNKPFDLCLEIRRVLKNDGLIYVETPNWTSILVPSFGFKREQHDPFNFFDDPSHTKPWSKHGLFEYLSQSCDLQVIKVGTVRNWYRILLDIPIILYGLARGKRGLIINSFWNIYGWCIYGIATKK